MLNFIVWLSTFLDPATSAAFAFAVALLAGWKRGVIALLGVIKGLWISIAALAGPRAATRSLWTAGKMLVAVLPVVLVASLILGDLILHARGRAPATIPSLHCPWEVAQTIRRYRS